MRHTTQRSAAAGLHRCVLAQKPARLPCFRAQKTPSSGLSSRVHRPQDQDQEERERDLAPRFFLHAGSRREKTASREAPKMMGAGVGTTPLRSRHTGTGHRASVLLRDTPRTSLESKSWPSSLRRHVDRFSRWCNPRGQARELTSDASRALACADPSIGHVDRNLPPSRLRNNR